MRKPPKHTKNSMSSKASQYLGSQRECTQCGDEKLVSEQTFALSNKLKGGWHTVCRVCQASEKSGIKQSRVPKPIIRTAGEITDIIDEMYLEALKPKPDIARLEEIVGYLGAKVRDLPDRESFMLFVDIVKPMVAGWMEPGAIHEDIIDGLMSKHRRRLIIATRYSAKSTLTGIWICWRIFREPLIKIMVISRGSKLAARMLRTVRQVFIANCPMLAHMRPDDTCLDNAEQFQVPASTKVTTGGATLTSLGMGSNLPGFRSDLTVGDDIEGPQENTTEKVLDLQEILNELHMINPKGEKVMLGTYQSEFSIYAVLADIEDRDGTPVWEEHRACMFEENPDDKDDIRSRWPGMFSDLDAKDWRKSVTERAWRLHAMLIADPKILNERPLKISNFITVDWPADKTTFYEIVEAGGSPLDLNTWAAPKGDVWFGPGDIDGAQRQYVTTIVGIDPASGLAGRDAIGLAVIGITASGHGVIRHLEGVRGPDKLGNIRRCASLIARFHANHVVVEELADGLFGETLEGQMNILGYPMAVEKITGGGMQKGRRIIETLGPPMAAGRLIMLESVAASDEGGEFTNQLTRISYDGRTGKAKDHDDIVDALAHAVANQKSSLVSSVEDNIANSRAARLSDWRGISLRYGGLGVSESDNRNSFITLGDPSVGGLPLGERLIEEDEVLSKYKTKLEFLQDRHRTMARQGASNEALHSMVLQITRVRAVVTELMEADVL